MTISGQVITIDPVLDLESGSQYTVTLLKDQVEDLWGNKLGTAQTATFTVDTDAPTLEIRGMPGRITDRTPFDVAFIFSEVVIGFLADDVTVRNGTLSNLVETTKGTEWSAQVTPRGGDDDVKVEVAADRVRDVAGNTGPTSAVSVLVVYDGHLLTLRPLRTDDVGAPSVTFRPGDGDVVADRDVDITVRFDKAVRKALDSGVFDAAVAAAVTQVKG